MPNQFQSRNSMRNSVGGDIFEDTPMPQSLTRE
jgi:hypothetical protein